jgi:hypothetical protein
VSPKGSDQNTINVAVVEMKFRRLLDQLSNEFAEWEIDEAKALVDTKRYCDALEALSLRVIEGRRHLSGDAWNLFHAIADELDIH